MALLNPNATTVNDICLEALRDAGAVGVGVSPNAEMITHAWSRLQWLLQQWERERYLIYHLVTYVVQSTGQVVPYTVGAGGQVNLGTAGLVARPNRIESAFFRQLVASPNGPIDYPLGLLPSMEDYNRIALKGLTSFTLIAFYDPAWPTGQLYVYPWPSANLYAIGITVREQLPASFPSLTSVIALPFEYYQAIVSNLALAVRPKYGLGTYPGDMVPLMAKNGLKILRKGNTAIPDLKIPPELVRPSLYNIFSDRSY